MGTGVESMVDRLRTALAARYSLGREIGRGGMAHVYHAHDLQHDRDVAIKVLRPELAAALGTERFLREIRIEARLQHPHILPLFDSGTSEGFFYYVMPFVEGETLRDRIRREKQLPVPDAVRITRQVAEALDYAHREGVLHRDIKPANILLGPGDHALVADFGIAKAVADVGDDALTTTGLAVGTPEYMSPEQGSGDHDLDRRSDVYALGCVLYEMLAGQPPFTGRSAQVVLARHRHDTPPSLRVVRPALPVEIEQAVEMALAKIPADRFPTTAALSLALEPGTPVRPVVRQAVSTSWLRASRIRLTAAAGIAALAVGALWWMAVARPEAPDANKVMVFPLVEHAQGGPANGAGEAVAIMIGSALEHTEPLKWIDGWTWLEPSQRSDIRALSGRAARAMALAQGAHYYIDGSVVRGADSATVILRLHDNVGDSTVAQASESAALGSAAPAQLGLRAVAQLLPVLLQTGRRPDPAALDALGGRAPAAVANWLQGEREYRRARFGPALDYYRRAVQEDSLLAFAALRGAEAAWWMGRDDEVAELARLAIEHASALPPKYAELAVGLGQYLDGAADSALAHIGNSIRADPALSVGWMMLGEVYSHLFPTVQRPLSSLAEEAFQNARRVDPGFTPPIYHLTELALRRKDPARARQLLVEYRRSGADAARIAQLELMTDCAERGPEGTRWDGRAPADLFQAAKSLSAGAAYPQCAVAGFRAVLPSDSVDSSIRWAAIMGLQSMLLIGGQARVAEAVLDSAAAGGIPAANALFVLDALAGLGLDTRAGAVVDGLGGTYAGMKSSLLWFVGAWAARRGDVGRVDSIVQALNAATARSGDRGDSLLARAVTARLVLLRGDTASAIGLLRSLHPIAPSPGLSWGFWEALGGERLMLAELLHARGQDAEALRVAEEFDHPDPVVYLLYIPASLRIRAAAARGLGDEASALRYERRLHSLAIPTS
jgi:tRNA A-37 threonylcarbamoyl transferase component Bud32